MGFFKEFKDFALKGNVMDMAVGVIIGGAFSTIVTGLTQGILTPIVSVCTGAITFDELSMVMPSYLSAFISSIINFLITAFVLFAIIKAIRSAEKKAAEIAAAVKGETEEAPAPTTKVCPYCMSEININAVKCPHCTSDVE